MAKIKIRIAAKTDVGLERQNNEDNFQVSSDLSILPMRWVNNDVCNLGVKGALLVVADGMGGMNAGEVASQIAIDIIREEFIPQKITSEVIKSRFSIEKFMNDIIIKADARIKEVSNVRPETKGMGTTIVIAWLLDDTLYVSWCGDSRAYVYNSNHGLHRLTKDHSYVQQLIDTGKLSEEEAFDFPESNIITRCLCDSKQKAQPECLYKPYPVCDGDIILLCTDGLCGMIRDNEILDIMHSFQNDMSVLTENLVHAALSASGADNCTVCVCQIWGGKNTIGNYFSISSNKGVVEKFKRLLNANHKGLLIFLLCLIFLVIGASITWFISKNNDTNRESIEVTDSLVQQKDSTVIIESIEEERTIDGVDISFSNPKEVAQTSESHSLNSKIDGLTIPKTISGSSTKDTDRETTSGTLTQNYKESEIVDSIEETREIVIEKLPENVSLQQFAQRHGMNYLDMKRLNPDIKNWKNVKPGTLLKVYKQ